MSSKSTSERPPTCQGPVRPGFTARRCMAHSSYCATSRGSGGRGPTTDMSPTRTLRNWGNSSMECLRMKCPILVTRGSSFILNMGPSTSFSASRASFILSAPFTIERNFHMVNSRGLPSAPMRPTRFWRYSGHPGLSMAIAAQRTNDGTKATVITAAENTISKHRFTKRYPNRSQS